MCFDTLSKGSTRLSYSLRTLFKLSCRNTFRSHRGKKMCTSGEMMAFVTLAVLVMSCFGMDDVCWI